MIKRILLIFCFVLWLISFFAMVSTKNYLNLTRVMPDHEYGSIKYFSKKSADVDFDWYVFDADQSETKEFRSLAAGKVYDLSDDSAIKDKYGYEEPFSIHLVHYEPLNENNTNDGCRISVDSVTDSHGNVIDVDDTFEIRKGHGIEQVYNYAFKYVLWENYASEDASIITRFIKYFPPLSKVSNHYWFYLGVLTVITAYLFWFAKDQKKSRFLYIVWIVFSIFITTNIIWLCIVRMNDNLW